MESRKRKQEGAGKEEGKEARKVAKVEGSEQWGWRDDTLPCELVAYILFLALSNPSLHYYPSREGHATRVTQLVCKRVCKLWRSVLPLPLTPPPHRYGCPPFDFAR